MAAPVQLLKGFAKVAVTTKPDPKKRLTISDPDTRGLYVRITPKGARTWTIVARDPEGKQVWREVGDVDLMSLSDAREKAREGVARIKAGQSAFEETAPTPPMPDLFPTVLDTFITRHVKKAGLRNAPEIERAFKKYVTPEWKERPFASIRRSDVTKLVDKIEDENGPVQADRTLAYLSKLFSWYQSREDDYVSPVVRGMRRTNAKERARDRVLSDEEIRALWSAASGAGAFGAFLQLLLLTGQRRAKVMAMRWEDVSEDGVWTIPTEAREKGNPGTIKLPKMARDILAARTPVKDNPFVFPGRGETAMALGDKLKKDFDEITGFSDWRLHDLRRTAKTLMRRAGVSGEISERVLGHVIGGVEGVYDRYDYEAEKTAALEKLAGLVALILDPQDNVVQMGRVT